MAMFYCLSFETPATWRASPRIYIPQEQGGTVITSRHWATVEVFDSPSTVVPYLTGNSLRLRYKAQPVNAV
jgi:hypothetical protein